MPRVIKVDPPALAATGNLTPFEQEAAQYFISIADTFHVPKSLALIYTIIFCSEEPISFEEINRKTGLSKSRVSDGLKALVNNGVIQDLHYDSNRRTYYQPEGSIRGWLNDLVNDKVSPQVMANAGKIKELQAAHERHHKRDDAVAQRLESFANWNKRLQQILPIVLGVIGLAAKKKRTARSRKLSSKGGVFGKA